MRGKMIKVNDKLKYAHLFNAYEHNIPVIYSALEGQYESDLYVNDEQNPEFALLFTAFDYHYVGGHKNSIGIVSSIRDLVFSKYLKEKQSKEAILVTPNASWRNIMKEVFDGYSEIVDKRYIYRLNHQKFQQVDDFVQQKRLRLLLEQEAQMQSKSLYDVAKLEDDYKLVSYCSAFMLGGGHAEIDVKTDEAYRRKGYAKMTSIHLIKHLLNKSIEPDWTCWEHKIASQKLAESIGFEKVNEVEVYIWVEAVNGKLN